MKQLGNPKTNMFVPDYDTPCENCEQTPTVKLESASGKSLTHFEMCGPCMFGQSDMVDPDLWNF